MKPKLEIELVPSSARFLNLNSILDMTDWDTLKKSVFDNSNNKCEICGDKGDDIHEVWEYINFEVETIGDADEVYIQKLVYCQLLCYLCHEVKHFGLAQVKQNGERAKETIKRINGWDDKQVEDYVRMKFKEWHLRSKHKWEIDISKISDYGIDATKYANKL